MLLLVTPPSPRYQDTSSFLGKPKVSRQGGCEPTDAVPDSDLVVHFRYGRRTLFGWPNRRPAPQSLLGLPS